MKAGIEWFTSEVGVLRVGSCFNEYGDPYEASGTVFRPKPPCSKTTIMGFTSQVKFTRQMRRAIEIALADEGITDVIWERRKTDSNSIHIQARREK